MSLPLDSKPITNLSMFAASNCILAFDHEILADCALNINGLALEDFLWVLYDYFQQQISVEEHEKMLLSRLWYNEAARAMGRRCAKVWDPCREWHAGFKRIDCLGKSTWLGGVYVDEDWDQEEDVVLRMSFASMG